jgi:hypothetical protein
MNSPSECFLITDFSPHGIQRWKDGTIYTLRCYTHDGSFITFWGTDKFAGGTDNIDELLELEDMLPILVECEYNPFSTHKRRLGHINWHDEADIIDFNLYELLSTKTTAVSRCQVVQYT